MAGRSRDYVVLATPWNHGWDVFVLDPATGLVGATVARSRDEIESAAADVIRGHPEHGRHPFRLDIVS